MPSCLPFVGSSPTEENLQSCSLIRERTTRERELRDAFAQLSPALQEILAPRKIAFHFNPPAALHFGRAWEREIRLVKSALYVTVVAQPVTEEVMHTVLIEVEEILNSKPLGYVSSEASEDTVQ